MTFLKLQPRQFDSRPTHYTEFLLHPIADDPTKATWYPDWEHDHGDARRFFVGGMQWFLRRSGFKARELEPFAKAAVAEVKKLPTMENVKEMPNSGDHWNALSRNQIKAARDKEPMFIQKCILLIIACELATAAALEAFAQKKGADATLVLRGKALDKAGVTSATMIYSKMAVVPAVWNINDFYRTYEELAKLGPAALSDVTSGAGQRSVRILEGLGCFDQKPKGVGRTVTYTTARKVRAAVKELYSTVWVGGIRATPGQRHGRGKAMAEEVIDIG